MEGARTSWPSTAAVRAARRIPRVVDAVSSGESGADEGEGLHADMTTARSLAKIDGLVEEVVEPQLLGERGEPK